MHFDIIKLAAGGKIRTAQMLQGFSFIFVELKERMRAISPLKHYFCEKVPIKRIHQRGVFQQRRFPQEE